VLSGGKASRGTAPAELDKPPGGNGSAPPASTPRRGAPLDLRSPCRADSRTDSSSMLYCPRLDCQRAKSSKTSDEHRHHKARALALYADGVPAEEIAEREGSRLKIVRRWIEEAKRTRKRKAGK